MRIALLLTFLLPTTLMAQNPPVAPVRTVTETHHGITVEDPYRYMEDFKSAEVQAWVKAQADYAEKTLRALPQREKLLKRIEELDAGAPYSLFGLTRVPSGDLYYFKQLADENVAKVYVRRGETETLLIDPETFPKADKADHFTISFFRVSPDEKRLLYGFAASGSEQTSLKVFDIASNKDLPDTIDRLEAEYAGPHWLPNSQAFVYSRRRKLPDDAPPTEGYKFTQAFLHEIGGDPDKDQMVFANGAKGSPAMGEMDFPALIVTPGSKWVIGQVKHGDETDLSLYAAPLASVGEANIAWKQICDRTDLVTDYAVHGDDVYLLTAKNAPRFKVVRTSLKDPDFDRATEEIKPGDSVIQSLDVARDGLYIGMLRGAQKFERRLDFHRTKLSTLASPADEPSASVVASHPLIDGVYLQTKSWTRAGRLYRYDPQANKLVDTKLLPVGKFDVPEGLTAKEVLVTSHDGVKVPLSIIHRSDIKLDGSNPALIGGYGAYGFSNPMNFDPVQLAWLERGGVIAVAHVRGGGALGKEWHHAGRMATKPNTWKDFIACAEYLVKQGYTSPGKLAGKGGSAGGILIGRAITERPDLFAAAQISVGCTDMLRFETTMNGPPNVPEFGTIAKEDEFRGLLAMSTLHHIKDGVKYPAIILTHGINDPRVEPWISAKAAARFQAATASGRPVLFRVDYHSGHGIGSTRTQRHEELADVWSFMLDAFGK
jgi:prolyl oligopeptidase